MADAVKARRLALGLTAAELSDRTKCGKPLSRAVISDLETGRKRTLDVSEWLTLAAALDIPPVLLLYPGYPDAQVEVLPCHQAPGWEALDWVAGIRGLPPKRHPDRTIEIIASDEAGIELISAVHERADAERDIFFREINQRSKGAPQEVAEMNGRILRTLQARAAAIPAEIAKAKEDLWGTSSRNEDPGSADA